MHTIIVILLLSLGQLLTLSLVASKAGLATGTGPNEILPFCTSMNRGGAMSCWSSLVASWWSSVGLRAIDKFDNHEFTSDFNWNNDLV